MLDPYTRMAVTLADLDYEPFPDVTEAIPELAEKAARLHTRLHTSPDSVEPAGPPAGDDPAFFPGCEGGDLNPDALSGASTSS
jgi:hypothetical protein